MAAPRPPRRPRGVSGSFRGQPRGYRHGVPRALSHQPHQPRSRDPGALGRLVGRQPGGGDRPRRLRARASPGQSPGGGRRDGRRADRPVRGRLPRPGPDGERPGVRPAAREHRRGGRYRRDLGKGTIGPGRWAPCSAIPTSRGCRPSWRCPVSMARGQRLPIWSRHAPSMPPGWTPAGGAPGSPLERRRPGQDVDPTPRR
jgi:hypothetical protein